jgi:dihydroorotate dehydrogenase (fumarate)
MDLSTHYMGLALKHPVVASACPLSESLDGIRRLEDGGAAAIVMFSLFEEQIRREEQALDRLMDSGSDSFAESLSYFPEPADFSTGPEGYLNLVRRAVEATEIPIIASLNCVSSEGWADYAREIEQAGAHGLELNIYAVEADLDTTSEQVEQRYLDSLRLVKQAVSIPVALKLSPFFSAFGRFAKQLDSAGADALVLFNRFYQPDFNIETLEIAPTLTLSRAGEIRLALLWIALLHGKVNAGVAATGGVEGATEVVKFLLAGATVVMSAAALLRNGPGHSRVMVEGLGEWMDQHGFSSVGELRGAMSSAKVPDAGAFERANYIRILESYR